MGKFVCYPHPRFEKPLVEVSPSEWICPTGEAVEPGSTFAMLIDAVGKAKKVLTFERKISVNFSGKVSGELLKCQEQSAQFEFLWQAFDNGRPRRVWQSGRVPVGTDWTCMQTLAVDPAKVACANSLYCAIVNTGADINGLGLRKGSILWEQVDRHSLTPGDEHFEKCLLDFAKNDALQEYAGLLVHIRLPGSLDEDAFNADHPLVLYVNAGHYLHGSQFEDKLTYEMALTQLLEYAIDEAASLRSEYAEPMESIPPEERRMGHHLAQLCKQAGLWDEIEHLSTSGVVSGCQGRIRRAAAGLLKIYDGVAR